MNEKFHYKILNILGVFYILLGILAILYSIFLNRVDQIYWFCYFSAILIGVGILKRNSYLIASQLNILGIPLVFWITDFFYYFFTKTPLWGITNYFFESQNIISNFLTLQHLYTIPVIIYSLYVIKLKRNDMWKMSFFQLILVYILTFFFTSYEFNTNCVFHSCVNFIGLEQIYPFIWFATFFLMVLITNFAISKVKIFRAYKKNQAKFK